MNAIARISPINLLSRLVAVLILLCCRPAVAVETPAASALPAVKRMLTALDFGNAYVDSAVHRLSELAKANPAMARDYESMGALMTADEAVERMAPIYAEHLTAKQANELREFFSNSPGRKVWPTLLQRLFAGKFAFPPPLSPLERMTVDSFMARSGAWRTLLAAQKPIASKLGAVSERWGQELFQRTFVEVARQMADSLERDAVAEPESRSKAPLGATVTDGQGMLSGVLALMKEFNGRQQEVINRLTAKAAQVDLEAVLDPKNLMALDRIDASRRKIDTFEEDLSAAQRELNQLIDELVAAARRLAGQGESANSLLQRFEQGLSVSFERMMRSEENQRRVLGATRQLLDLFAQRLGSIRFEEKRLLFDDEADQRRYETLRRQLLAEAQVEAEILQEQKAARQSAIKTLRSGGLNPAE